MIMVNYFKDIFQSQQGDMSMVLRCIDSKITKSQNQTLIVDVRYEKVKTTTFSMHPDKSPRSDGFNPGLF